MPTYRAEAGAAAAARRRQAIGYTGPTRVEPQQRSVAMFGVRHHHIVIVVVLVTAGILLWYFFYNRPAL